MAKNRRTIITEIFDALGNLDECQYDSDSLWEFFYSCVDNKSLKKLSQKRNVELTEDGTVVKSRGKSGYQHFMSSFTDEIPEGENKRKYKTKAWYDLSEEERDNWKEQAQIINEENGIIKKSSSDMNEEMKQFREEYLIWTNSDPETRGPEPIRPGSNNSSDESSRPASPNNSDSESINEESNIDSSNVQKLTDAEEKIENQLSKLQISDSESEGDDDDDEDEDDEDEIKRIRIKWLKTLSWKSNTPSDFKAWVMFSDPEKFGPDKDTTLEGGLLVHYKNIHNYDETAKSKDSPWNKFLKKNAIKV